MFYIYYLRIASAVYQVYSYSDIELLLLNI